ncbi:hypothetical protein JN540_08310 [Streptococcus suis]|nr:hypothetical protein [Streptococcus suis]
MNESDAIEPMINSKNAMDIILKSIDFLFYQELFVQQKNQPWWADF